MWSSSAHADWINLSGAENAPTIAEIYIQDDHVQLILEIYVGDLFKFEQLLPDDFFQEKIVGRPPLEERLKSFSEETFQFVTEDGKNLQAEIKLFEPRLRKERQSQFAGMINPMTGRPVPGPLEDKRVLYAELIYPFETKPKQLTIIPPLEKNGMASVSIGFTAYHKEAPIIDFKYLSKASTVNLDWEDTWYSAFEDRALRRWQQSGVQSFIYIEPFEVRHEILVRVKDLAAWMVLELRGNEFIEVDEFNPLRQRAGQFFLNRDKVLIDGKQLRPILDRTSFLQYSMVRSRFIDVPERLPLSSAMVGVIITYLTDGIPNEVSVEWDLFSKRLQKVPTNAIDPAGPFPSYVTPDDNVHVWKNYLRNYKIPTVENVTVADSIKSFKLPVGSIFCLAAIIPIILKGRKRRTKGEPIHLQFGVVVLLIVGSFLIYPHFKLSLVRPKALGVRLTDEQANIILHSLLKNVYRAFDFRQESEVYDKLAISVNGELLSDIYLQNRKSLVVQRAGGAQAKVKDVEVLNVSIQDHKNPSGALVLKSRWTAFGTVGHWGHIHGRKNLYDALITLGIVDGAWKIIGLELLEEKRIDPYAKAASSDNETG
jgi:hypothetical protein